MQTLWNRVAQVRCACRCPQCISAAHGVSRRATTSATRRVPKYLTSSTLWYSGVFAAAATFDAGAKNRRKEQWARAIADAQRELNDVEDVIVRNEQLLPREEQYHNRQAIGMNPEEEVAFDGDALAVQQALDDNLNSSVSRPFVPGMPANTGTTTNSHRMPPQSIYASSSRKHKHAQTRMSDAKLERLELTFDLLQLKTFAELKSRGLLQAAAACVPSEYAEIILKDSRVLSQMYDQKRRDFKRFTRFSAVEAQDEYHRDIDDIALSRFRQDGTGTSNATTQELNSSLRHLFEEHLGGMLPRAELLAKVYYNLFVSSAPPNIDTFNTLILGFARSREPEQVRNLISALTVTNMRANEVTLASVLRFFTATEDSSSFYKWLGSIEGRRGGLMLARPDIVINKAGSSRLIDMRDGAKYGKVVQLPRQTPVVFSSIVRGVLKFNGFEAALAVCEGMGNQGWGLCMSGLAPLLKDCAKRNDWSSGLAVWEEIKALQKRTGTPSGRSAGTIQVETYISMLRLCSRCEQREKFEEILDQARLAHRMSHQAIVRFIQKVMQDEAEWKYAKSVDIAKLDDDFLGEDASVISRHEDDTPSGAEVEQILREAPREHGSGQQQQRSKWRVGQHLDTFDHTAVQEGGASQLTPSIQDESAPSRDVSADPRTSDTNPPDHRKVPVRTEPAAETTREDRAATPAPPRVRIRVVSHDGIFQKPLHWISGTPLGQTTARTVRRKWIFRAPPSTVVG